MRRRHQCFDRMLDLVKWVLLLGLLASVLVGVLTRNAWAQLASTPWPMFQHDPQHTGRSPFLGPQVARLQWAFDSGSPLSFGSPAIGSEGTIYVGADKLYAVTSAGTQKWAIATGVGVTTAPAIGSDGTIYVGTGDGKLFAITPAGTLKWAIDAGTIEGVFPHFNPIFSSPAIGGAHPLVF